MRNQSALSVIELTGGSGFALLRAIRRFEVRRRGRPGNGVCRWKGSDRETGRQRTRRRLLKRSKAANKGREPKIDSGWPGNRNGGSSQTPRVGCAAGSAG